MQPKLIALSIAGAFAGLSAPLHAGPLDRGELKAMAYVSLPFGGVSRRQEAPMLGFTLDRTLRERDDGFSYHPSLFQQTPASTVRSLLDIRFDARKQTWDRFRVAGVDALSRRTRINADGTTETVAEVAEIPTAAIVAGVAIGVVVVHDATKKDNPPQAEEACAPGFVRPPGVGICVPGV